MSKLFKIITKLIVRDEGHKVFLIKNADSVYELPEFELDFNYKNIDDFLDKKFHLSNSLNDNYGIISTQIRKRELYGELIYIIGVNPISFIADKFIPNGEFLDINSVELNAFDKNFIK